MLRKISRRQIGYAFALVAGIVFVAFSAVLVEVELATREWESLGGSIDDDLPWPAAVHLGCSPGVGHSPDVGRITKALSRFRRLPGCDRLAIGNINKSNPAFSEADVERMINAFEPDSVTVYGLPFGDHGIGEVLKLKTVVEIGLADCPITAKGVRQILETGRIRTLSLSSVDIDRRELDQMSSHYGSRLILWLPKAPSPDERVE